MKGGPVPDGKCYARFSVSMLDRVAARSAEPPLPHRLGAIAPDYNGGLMAREQTKIKSRDVMPEILDLLKRERGTSTASIGSRMRAIAADKGLIFRKEAVSFSLTVLRARGWASNPKRGSWCVTRDGSGITLHKDEVDALGGELWGSCPHIHGSLTGRTQVATAKTC